MKLAHFIPCRMGSTRLRGKPLLDICGLPMFAHVYFRTKLVFNNVVVCTPDEEIAEVCKKYKIKYCMTEHDHVNGTERIAEAARIFRLRDEDIIVNIQGDDPLVLPEDVQKLTSFHWNRPNVGMVIPHIVCKDIINNNLSIKMVTNSQDRVLYMSRNMIPSNYREKLEYKKHLSIYSFRNDALQLFANTPETELERSEACEGLRAMELDIPVKTFPLENEYTPVDVKDQYYQVCKIMENDETFLKHYIKKVRNA